MAVPWTQIIRWAPQILSVSRDLLQRSRRDAPPPGPATPGDGGKSGLAARIAALEDNERRQAELVDRMAAQQAELARAVVTLHRQVRWLLVATIVLTLGVVGAIVWRTGGA